LERDNQYTFFANLLHLPLSLAVGSNIIDLTFSLVGKLAWGISIAG
jgi:hypothetical protein